MAKLAYNRQGANHASLTSHAQRSAGSGQGATYERYSSGDTLTTETVQQDDTWYGFARRHADALRVGGLGLTAKVIANFNGGYTHPDRYRTLSKGERIRIPTANAAQRQIGLVQGGTPVTTTAYRSPQRGTAIAGVQIARNPPAANYNQPSYNRQTNYNQASNYNRPANNTAAYSTPNRMPPGANPADYKRAGGDIDYALAWEVYYEENGTSQTTAHHQTQTYSSTYHQSSYHQPTVPQPTQAQYNPADYLPAVMPGASANHQAAPGYATMNTSGISDYFQANTRQPTYARADYSHINTPPARQAEASRSIGDTYMALAFRMTGVFEGGSIDSINATGSDGLSYGKHQASLGEGVLFQLLALYRDLGGQYANQLSPYMERCQRNDVTLGRVASFQDALRTAARDPIMALAQDKLFRENYWNEAQRYIDQELRYETNLALVSPLTFAIIYDSWIQHGASARVDQWGITGTKGIVGWALERQPNTEQQFLLYVLDGRERILNAQYEKAAANGDKNAVRYKNAINGRITPLRQQVSTNNLAAAGVLNLNGHQVDGLSATDVPRE